MKLECRKADCPGEYEERTVLHVQRYRGRVVVIDHVPAFVCRVCGEVFFSLDTARSIERLLEASGTPASNAPVYEFA